MFGNRKDDSAPQVGWGSEAEGKARLEALWPKDESGEREQAVFLSTIPDFNNEADFAVNMLMAYGIPAFKSYNNEGALGKLILGTSAYSPSLYVPMSMLEDAKALLAQPAEDEADNAVSGAEENGEA